MKAALKKASPIAAGLIISLAKLGTRGVTCLGLIVLMVLLAVIVIFGVFAWIVSSRHRSDNLGGILLALRGKP
jgi:uncharacterized membrane protein